MIKLISVLVFTFASSAMAENVWYNCSSIDGQSVQVLRNATIVIGGSYITTEMYSNTRAGQDYVSANGQLIFSKRSNSAAIYDGRLNKIANCSEKSSSGPYPVPYDPDQFGGCDGCWNDGGFP